MKGQLDALSSRFAFALDVIDIDGDPELRAEYNWDVQVLLVDGKKIAKYRLDEAMLVRRLENT
jgi:Glutaredoxin-like domain (DUF836)